MFRRCSLRRRENRVFILNLYQALARDLSKNRSQWQAGLLIIAFIISAILFAWLQTATAQICCGDFDGYYHIKWSRLLWEGIRGGHLPRFTWLPLTSLNADRYADQHLLFHLLLIPFTWFGDLAAGARVAAIFFASLAVCSCFWLILRYRISYAGLWLLALLGSSSLFLFRMSMTRAQSVSVIFVALGIFLLFEGKYRWLALLGFLYVWTYNLFVILILMVLLWEGAGWWSESHFNWRPILWTMIGIVAGFVLNPYFPNDLRLFFQHLMARGLEGSPEGIGAEWYALSSWLMLKTSFVAFAAMFVGCVSLGYLLGAEERRALRRPIFMFLLCLSLLIATARSKRFAEYWPASAVLFAAFTLPVVWDRRTLSATNPPKISESIEKQYPASTVAIVAVLLLASAAYQSWFAREMIATPAASDQYRGATQWLLANVPRGEMIFNASWEDFPKLFYYDDAHSYVSGLDPLYLERGNPELAALYERITAGKERQAGELIRDRFGARYVFLSGLSNRDFKIVGLMGGQFERVYADRDCMILKVRDRLSPPLRGL